MIFNIYTLKELVATIYADFEKKEVSVTNYTNVIIDRPFGINEHPTWERFEQYLESRCIPRTRHHLDWHLKELGLTEYNPLEIIKRTDGKMAGDYFSIEVIENEKDKE